VGTITGLRVSTWVYASPVRPAWITAWEAHSLSVLTEGRFEMGIGTGRPGIADQFRGLGLPDVPMSQRSSQVRDVIAALRDLDGPTLHTPVAMAVGGPKSQALAAELADIATFVMPQTETRADTTRRVRDFDNRRDLELALHVQVVGDRVAPFMPLQTQTQPPCALRTRWPVSHPIPERRGKRSNAGGRRSGSPTTCSEPTSPTPSVQSSPSWPGPRKADAETRLIGWIHQRPCMPLEARPRYQRAPAVRRLTTPIRAR
jgi:alkanesulfonate monooxygenase SsuD/methylene tetrahydromethanopterin reductase-like flavin-dependent oxidoreductase (luciferase family)